MFTIGTDFDKLPYTIPSTDEGPSIDDFILHKEQVCLRSILGSTLYNIFVAALFEDPNADPLVAKDDEDIDQIWKDLRDGGEYEYNGNTYTYDGLVNFLKPYIKSEWIKENVHTLTASGIVEPKLENSVIVDPSKQIALYYNEFSTFVGNCFQYKDTLWGFLKANEGVYENWCFKNPGRKNMFGL